MVDRFSITAITGYLPFDLDRNLFGCLPLHTGIIINDRTFKGAGLKLKLDWLKTRCVTQALRCDHSVVVQQPDGAEWDCSSEKRVCLL